ncbi:MAG TPA: hypothetical protein VF744_06650 [Beijerinckiaceae bacterium]|jgi:hypothetical protein
MTTFRKTISSALAAITMGAAVLGSAAPAEARGGAFAAGVIGGLAVGAIAAQAAQPRTVYVGQRTYVRKHRCGCMVHYHVYRY